MLSARLILSARAPLAAFAAMGVIWGSFAAMLPDLKTQLGVAEAELGLLMLLTPLAAVGAMLVAPALGARLGRTALPLAASAMALAFTLPGQVHTLWLFPLVMLLTGAATGLTDVLMNARTATLEATRGQHLMTICHAAYSFGYAAGAIGTGLMRDASLGPGTISLMMACAALACASLTWEAEGRIEGLAQPREGGPGLGLTPLIGGGIVLIAFLTENAAENWSALHIEQTLGGSPAEGALGPAALALTMGFARIAGQGLAGRISPRRLLTGGACLAACGALIAAAAPSPALAHLGFIVMGLGASVIAPTAFSLVGESAAPEARARAVARATLYGYFGYFFGPPLLGLIAGSLGLRAAFVFAAAMLLSVLLLAPLLLRRR
ncbi:MAG: MFS transporter [Gemmobacter sp.]|uniref:MFS transporter n=1 Tax=Gemmobacter sp. TaxID=1898957 RepID=UPI001A5B9532|nr:MFS transporter [Gemmobacter sp.]MBL8563106.1 MFS transporter [Gemmobacter sp.]